MSHQALWPQTWPVRGTTGRCPGGSPGTPLKHLLELVRGLEAKGAYRRLLGGPIDTATPQGRFMLQMLGAVAEFEHALIRERVISGLSRAAWEGRRGGNPVIRARDPDALRPLQHAREDAYLAKISAGADTWLPLVAKLRIEEGHTLDEVVRAVNIRLSAKGAGVPSWTQARLVRAVRALVPDGLAPAELLQYRDCKRTPAASERGTVLQAVAAIVGEARMRRCAPSVTGFPRCVCIPGVAALTGRRPPWCIF